MEKSRVFLQGTVKSILPPRDFNGVLGTINVYQIYPAKYFCSKISSLSTVYEKSVVSFFSFLVNRNNFITLSENVS